MDSVEAYFARQEKILKDISPIIRKSGVELILAKDVKSNQIYPERVWGNSKLFTNKKMKRIDYDELQDRTQSSLHIEMTNNSVDYFLKENYSLYKGGVGVKGIYVFADFVAEKEGKLIFGECLTGTSLNKIDTLRKKMQLAQYGKMCFTVPKSAIEIDNNFNTLSQISRSHYVFIYFDVGFGNRENHLINFNIYTWILESSRKIPPLVAEISKKRSMNTLKLQFNCRIPETINTIELKETWLKILRHFISENKRKIFTSVRQKRNNNSYLLTFEPKDFSSPHYTKKDMLTIRITDNGAEFTFKSNWGKSLLKNHFLGLLKRKGIDQKLKSFIDF